MSFSRELEQAAAAYGLSLTAGQIDAFALYFELLVAWNEKVNLTAITQPREVAVKHIIDSLSCYEEQFFPGGCSLADIGTGAGFPGLPLKILRPDLQLTLLDSLNKRLVFLRDVVEKLGLEGVSLVHARAEDGARQKDRRGCYQIAVSRAVARLNVLSELCLPFVKQGGYFIALKGAQYREELGEAGRALSLLGGEVRKVRPVALPGLDDSRAIIYIHKVGPTPATYPRKAGTPEKKPLR